MLYATIYALWHNGYETISIVQSFKKQQKKVMVEIYPLALFLYRGRTNNCL